MIETVASQPVPTVVKFVVAQSPSDPHRATDLNRTGVTHCRQKARGMGVSGFEAVLLWEQDVGGSRLHLSEVKKSLCPDQKNVRGANYEVRTEMPAASTAPFALRTSPFALFPLHFATLR